MISIDKLKSEIENYNNDIASIKDGKFSDTFEMGVIANGRIIIEHSIEIAEGKKIKNKTDWISNNLGLHIKYNWSQINNPLHKSTEDKNPKTKSINAISKIANLIIDNIGDLPKLEYLYENSISENWKDIIEEKKYFNDYICVVTNVDSSNYPINRYNLMFFNKANKGRKPKERIVYSEEILFINSVYRINAKRQNLVLSDKSITDMTRYFITDYEMIHVSENIVQNISEFKKKVIEKKKVNPFFYLLNNFRDEQDPIIKDINDFLKGEFLQIIEDKNWFHDFLKHIISIKYSLEYIVIENKKEWIPMAFEFWTKNPYESFFNISEKAKLLEYFEYLGIDVKKKPFFGKENLNFSLKLDKSGKLWIDKYPDWELGFKENNLFNDGYEEFKVVELNYKGKEFITKKEISDLRVLFDSLLSTQVKYQVESNLIKEDISWDDKKEYFEKIINQKISIISGPAGYGKTRLASLLMREFESQGEKNLFVGPTIKATRVIEEFHNEINPDIATIQKISNKPWNFPIGKYDNIFIDEITMINDNDWMALFKQLKDNHRRVIFIGDEKQLGPLFSVGFYKYIFSNIHKNHQLFLKKNFRQLNQPKLMEQLKKIRKTGKLSDLDFIVSFETIDDYFAKIENHKEYDVFLSPIKNGIFGVEGITSLLATTGNNFDGATSVIFNENIDHPQLKNILYKNKIIRVSNVNEISITFDLELKDARDWEYPIDNFLIKDKKIHYLFNEWGEPPFSNSKSITIHSSQGSTFERVCLVIPVNYNISSESLYTAASRAKTDFRILILEEDMSKITA